MSCTPPTAVSSGVVPTSLAAPVAKFVRSGAHSFPQGKMYWLEPLLAAYSHSRSVGRRHCRPTLADIQSAKFLASKYDTSVTGNRPLPAGTLLPCHLAGGFTSLSLTNSAYSSFVTSVRSR